MNPTETFCPRGRSRRLDCMHYSVCLSHAVRHGWAGFHCLACPVREAIPKIAPQRRGPPDGFDHSRGRR